MHIETLELQTGDLDAQEAFYGWRLGLPVARDHGRLEVTIGLSQLIFHHEAGFRGVYHFAFNIPENRLEPSVAYLEERGIPRISDENGRAEFDFASWNAHAVYFADPAGNLAEFIARHELPNGLPDYDARPFSAAELLNISEIGLPTGDVDGLAALLCETTGVTSYRDGGPAFAPLGDAHGLFILVAEGRHWYPDARIPAESLPVRVVVRNGAGERFSVTGPPYKISPL